MKVEQIGPTFWVPEKTVNFFGVKPVVPSYTLKMRKSHKKSAHVYAYTNAYTQIRDGGGRSAPPPALIGLKRESPNLVLETTKVSMDDLDKVAIELLQPEKVKFN